MRRRLVVLVTAFACALFATGAAFGQGLTKVQAPPLRQACVVDYMRFCRGVPPGRGRVILCLNARANELTQSCFQALALRGLASASALKACRIDYDRLCAQSGPGLHGLSCLLDNAQALSAQCRDALGKQGLLDDEPETREFRR